MKYMFSLTVTAIDKVLFQGQVKMVTCPAKDGEMTILKDHMPLISLLGRGELLFVDGKEGKHTIPLTKGFLMIKKSEVIALI